MITSSILICSIVGCFFEGSIFDKMETSSVGEVVGI